MVTILFTDVEGSTALHAARGDAVANSILGTCEQLLRREVEAHGGRVIKSLGDGLMISFESPRRAVACALAMQDAIRDCPDSAGVRVRAGIHAGEVVAMAGDLLGAAVNAAARICAKANGGEVLTSDVVRQLCGSVPEAAFEDRGRVTLKGFPERWRLYRVRPTRPVPAAPGRAGATPFVGRDAERAALERLIAQAAAGQGGLVIIGGEPGVGKTRLTEEIAERARRQGFRVFVGHCYESQGDLPYKPWVEMLETAARETPPDEFRRFLGDSAAEIARIVPAFRRMFPDIPPAVELPPDQQRQYMFASLGDYVARMSAMQPRLYVLDDLHWADESTLLFLEYLTGRLAALPILIVGTYRNLPVEMSPRLADTLSGFVRRHSALLLSIERHSEPEVAAMLEALSGHPPPAEVTGAVYGETEGNAFFVEELFRHLAETGALLDDTGQFRRDVRSSATR